MNHGKWIQKMNNQSKLISGKDSNRSQQKSGNDTETDHRKRTRGKKARRGVEPLEAWSPMTL